MKSFCQGANVTWKGASVVIGDDRSSGSINGVPFGGSCLVDMDEQVKNTVPKRKNKWMIIVGCVIALNIIEFIAADYIKLRLFLLLKTNVSGAPFNLACQTASFKGNLEMLYMCDRRQRQKAQAEQEVMLKGTVGKVVGTKN
ncbi:hypothetical protein STEG23_014464 [Scotinomys teguina]